MVNCCPTGLDQLPNRVINHNQRIIICYFGAIHRVNKGKVPNQRVSLHAERIYLSIIPATRYPNWTVNDPIYWINDPIFYYDNPIPFSIDPIYTNDKPICPIDDLIRLDDDLIYVCDNPICIVNDLIFRCIDLINDSKG